MPEDIPHDHCAGRHATAVDPAIRKANLARLRRIEGQIRGIHRMVEEDRYCPDVMTQVSAVQEALRAVNRELMRNHLHHCVTRAFEGGGEEAEAAIDELMTLMRRNMR